jgi:hypothetical protein
MYSLQNHFPHTVQPADNGKVLLSIEIEAIHVRAFLQMLESLGDFFRIINNKAKVALSYTRLPANQEKASKYYEEYCIAVIDTFKQLRHESDAPPRELLSATARYIKDIYPNSSYDSVKQILTKSGELKKSAFYKKNL